MNSPSCLLLPTSTPYLPADTTPQDHLELYLLLIKVPCGLHLLHVQPPPPRPPAFPPPTPAGIPAHDSTAWTLGWSWLIVFLNVATVTLAAVALLRVPALLIGAAALLTLSTSFLMPLCNNFLQARGWCGIGVHTA